MASGPTAWKVGVTEGNLSGTGPPAGWLALIYQPQLPGCWALLTSRADPVGEEWGRSTGVCPAGILSDMQPGRRAAALSNLDRPLALLPPWTSAPCPVEGGDGSGDLQGIFLRALQDSLRSS